MQQRKTKRTPVSKALFYAINRDIKEQNTYGNGGLVAIIAATHGVSDETVRAIRRAKTWPKYVEKKQDRRIREVAKATKTSPPAEDAGLPEGEMVVIPRYEYEGLQRQLDILDDRTDLLVTWMKKIDTRVSRLMNKRWWLWRRGE